MNKKLLLSILTGLTLYTANANAELFFSQDSNGNGLFEINVTTGAATLVGAGISGVTNSTVGLAPSADPDVLFGSTWSNLAAIQTDGSASAVIAPSGNEALAYCSGTNTLYGGLNTSFYSIDQATGVKTPLSAPPFDAEGIACDSATNTIYGVGEGTDLLAYDIGTNTWSTIGSIGVNMDNGGLAWDPTAGILYAIGGATDNLYTINPATAATTIVGLLGTTARGGLAIAGAVATTPENIPTLSLWGLMVAIFGLGFIGRRRVKK